MISGNFLRGGNQTFLYNLKGRGNTKTSICGGIVQLVVLIGKEVVSRLLNPKLITWTNASLFAVLFLQGEINSWARRLACY